MPCRLKHPLKQQALSKATRDVKDPMRRLGTIKTFYHCPCQSLTSCQAARSAVSLRTHNTANICCHMTSPAGGHMTSMTKIIQEIILQVPLLILISEGGLAMLRGQ